MSEGNSMTKVGAVRLLTSTHERTIPTEDVYFAFCDGRLTYDCEECKAACCRGKGYLLNGDTESSSHFAGSKTLHVFVNEDPGQQKTPSVSMLNLPPACFFLTEDGFCRIHVTKGSGAKPETCRLFPFNSLAVVGKYLVVRAHPSLCPLKVKSDGALDPNSRHTFVLGELQSAGVSAELTVCEGPTDLSIQETINLERETVTLAAEFSATRSYAEFAATQLVLTEQYVRSKPETASGRGVSLQVDAMNDFVAHCLRLLGVSERLPDCDDPELNATMVVATPILRSHLVFQKSPEEKTRSGQGVQLTQVPFMLLEVFVLAALAFASGMRAVRIQTLIRLLEATRSLLTLLSFVESSVMWKPGVMIPRGTFGWGAGDLEYERIVKALLPAQQRKAERSLGHLICDSGLSNSERSRFVKKLACRLHDKIKPTSEPDGNNVGLRRRLSAGMQRLAVSNLGEESLSKILVTGRR